MLITIDMINYIQRGDNMETVKAMLIKRDGLTEPQADSLIDKGNVNEFEQTHLYDYELQCWIVNGLVVRCGHPESMNCHCYGKAHEGELADLTKPTIRTVRSYEAEGRNNKELCTGEDY